MNELLSTVTINHYQHPSPWGAWVTCWTCDFWEFRQFKLSLTLWKGTRKLNCLRVLLLASLSVTVKEVTTGSPPCKLGVENSVSKTGLLVYWLCLSALLKKENNNLNNVRFESDVEPIFMNMLLLSHLLLPSAFSLKSGCEGSLCLSWNWRRELRVYSWVLEVGLVLVSTSLQTLPFWSAAMPQTHLRRPLFRPLGERIMNSFVRWKKVIHLVFRNITDNMVREIEGRVHWEDKSVTENEHTVKTACCSVRVLHSFTLRWMNWFSD